MSDGLRRVVGRVVIAGPNDPLDLESGERLTSAAVAYETYGSLAPDGANAVLLCHALTGSAHAAGIAADGASGWWGPLVGPGRAIDTRRWFVVCTNVLGSCYGSTGPTSIDRRTGVPYGDGFPSLSIRDIVAASSRAIERMGIRHLHAVVGGSMGGMQALEWALTYPDFVDRIVPIATCAQHTPWATGFNLIAREAIALGRRAGDSAAGLALARKVGMMTYRSSLEFEQRGMLGTGHFDVARYLGRHGEKLVARFDDASFTALSRAMDTHDITRGRSELEALLAGIRQRVLCIGISSDQLYPARDQRLLARLIPGARYAELDSPCGHDAFLIEFEQLELLLREFIDEGVPVPQAKRAEVAE